MLQELFTVGVFASTIRLATPYILAGLGETVSQRSGVLNLGADGVMLLGAFSAFYTVHLTQNLFLGVLVGMLVGLLLGAVMAFISVTLKAEQGISGIGMYLFGLGFSELLYQVYLGTPTSVSGFPPVSIPVLSGFPLVGPVFFQHHLLVYVAFGLVPILTFVLNRTTIGLNIRAVGQNPTAADAMDVSVTRVRYGAVMFAGMMFGLAGASLSIAQLNVFQQNITSGLGFIAVALVYFGRWKPVGVMLGALLFSFVNALQLQIRSLGIDIPSEFAVMAPYVITIIALVFASKQVERPTALTKPFMRGE